MISKPSLVFESVEDTKPSRFDTIIGGLQQDEAPQVVVHGVAEVQKGFLGFASQFSWQFGHVFPKSLL